MNGERHRREVQRDSKTKLPQKLPNRHRISLHVDDETVVCSLDKQYGYRTYQLNAEDEEWKEKIIQRAEEIKAIEQQMEEKTKNNDEGVGIQ